MMPPTRRSSAGERGLLLAGVLLLAGWAAVWGLSLCENRLLGGRFTWTGAWDFLGLDFLNPCLATRHWLAGGDPYREPFGDPREGTAQVAKFFYPPPVLPLFAWCGLLPPRQAVVVWTIVLAALAMWGAVLAWRTRRRLGLCKLPLPFVVAALLCSTPVIFALERGNFDLLVLPPLAGAAWALQRRSAARDLLAGGGLALATCLKVYPGLLVFSLLALGRWRALLCFAVAGLALGLPGLGYLPALHANLIESSAHMAPVTIWHTCHSLSNSWQPLWAATPFAFLGHVPGTVAAGVFVLGLGLAISCRVARCPDRSRVLYPYLLWLAALATFLPRLANDYNFYYLPLAALAVWDRRDPLAVHVGMALLLFWWQPITVPIGVKELFVFKVLGFLAVTASLGRRIAEQGQTAVDGRGTALALSPLQNCA